ncbi:hypothetical protein LTR37_006326 [Vermiconidia calcicola]|uniref:Uncharacterized protein n=1 Tax=Vermiconidia calcicola TaxID=1690605 RepID=A0ACC3NIK8_9PEZI|nr:hypothetical protein LTR37_006326 [Vermiconidia calcicola]
MSGYHGKNRPAPNGAPQGVQRSYATQLKEHDALFNTYEHLQGLPRGDAALTMLRKVASLVKPIMRKRNWKVQILAEFLPAEQNLLGLNINRGFKICIRLRYHSNPDLFLPVEQVVDTMLHELSHIIWGEHDARFHRLWDELRDEWETLIRKGYTGEGFLSEGKKLGGGGRIPPPHEMRRLARASAEKRQAQNKLTKGSGQRLGGTPLHLHGRDVRQIIADQVTRRNTIDKGCGSGRNDAVKLSDQSAKNSFKTKAEEDDANNRAIMRALYDLIEEEEEKKLQGTFSEAPTDGGLAWDPEDGLYDPKTERVPELSNRERSTSQPSEDEQQEWALQESMRSTPDITDDDNWPLRPTILTANNRSSSAPVHSTESKPSPISAFGTGHSNESPVLPMSPEAEKAQAAKRKRHAKQSSSLSNEVSAEPTRSAAEPNFSRPSTNANPAHSPIVEIDISDPFDPTAKPPDQWTCDICTCINPLQFLACDACGTERPQRVGVGNRGPRPKVEPKATLLMPAESESLGWNCNSCGAFMEHRWWTCSGCGKMKDRS